MIKSDITGRFNNTDVLIFALPFLIVNGILTGKVTSEPIVWYNQNDLLGLKIFDIPVEDFIYGMLLIVMNITFYEKIFRSFKIRKRSKQ